MANEYYIFHCSSISEYYLLMFINFYYLVFDLFLHWNSSSLPEYVTQVASMVSHLRQQRTAIDKRIVRISELGVPI